MKILAIETSCDETAAAIVEDGVTILGNAIASSSAMHQKFGGIVPEVAAREQLDCIIPVLTDVFRQSGYTLGKMDAIAVTVGPGLIGSLLVGVETAKTLSFASHIPLIPVHHVLAHMYANFIREEKNISFAFSGNPHSTVPVSFPAISLVVSGGHTELFLMKDLKHITWIGGTLDDAAGEAFDKTARLLGFGNLGGVAIQSAAQKFHGTRAADATVGHALPRPMLDRENVYNFSFSGLKTAVLRDVTKLKLSGEFSDSAIARLAYELQESITDVLVKKTLKAADAYHVKSILVSGGVSANTRLREKFMIHTTQPETRVTVHFPPVPLCTDNAAYIASYAYFRGSKTDWHTINASPDLSVEI